jgi:hypothetical protein
LTFGALSRKEEKGNMNPRTSVALFLLCVCRLQAAPPQQPAKPTAGSPAAKVSPSERAAINATIQTTVTTSPATGASGVVVSVDLLNLLAKTVTAFSYSVTGHYADGKEIRTDRGSDILSSTVIKNRAEPGVVGPSTLRSFETFHARLQLPTAADGSMPVLVEAEVTALLFEDRTALGDPAQIQSFLDGRKAEGQRLALVLADIATSRQDPQVTSAASASERASRLQALINRRIGEIQGQAPNDPEQSQRAQRLKTLTATLRSGTDLILDRIVRDNQAVQLAMVQQSTLGESK